VTGWWLKYWQSKTYLFGEVDRQSRWSQTIQRQPLTRWPSYLVALEDDTLNCPHPTSLAYTVHLENKPLYIKVMTTITTIVQNNWRNLKAKWCDRLSDMYTWCIKKVALLWSDLALRIILIIKFFIIFCVTVNVHWLWTTMWNWIFCFYNKILFLKFLTEICYQLNTTVLWSLCCKQQSVYFYRNSLLSLFYHHIKERTRWYELCSSSDTDALFTVISWGNVW